MKSYRIKATAEKVAQMSFSQYLDYRMQPPKGNDTLFARMPSQSYFITDKNQNLAVKELIRFETLQQDFDALCRKIGIVASLGHAKKSVQRDTRSTSDYYTKDCEEKVRKIYAPDFVNFGYAPVLATA